MKTKSEKKVVHYLKFVEFLLGHVAEELQATLQGIDQLFVVAVEIVQIACHVLGRRGRTSRPASSLNNAVPARLEFL
jgi:hypothetical protein